MDKRTINNLLKNQKVSRCRCWTEQEIKDLIALKNAGVTFYTIKNNPEIMKKYFPDRTKDAIRIRFQNV